VEGRLELTHLVVDETEQVMDVGVRRAPRDHLLEDARGGGVLAAPVMIFAQGDQLPDLLGVHADGIVSARSWGAKGITNV